MAEQIPQELINAWCSEWYRMPRWADNELENFIAAKACEWQRERDAMICDDLMLPEGKQNSQFASGWEIGTIDCAEAIRKEGE